MEVPTPSPPQVAAYGLGLSVAKTFNSYWTLHETLPKFLREVLCGVGI